MAAPKNNKYFDVSRPGKTPPSSSSRPLIVTDRPILKDPMVSPVDTKDSAKEDAPLSKTKEKVVAPPETAADSEVHEEASAEEPEEKPEPEQPSTPEKKPEPEEPKDEDVKESFDDKTSDKPAEKDVKNAQERAEREEKERQAAVNKLIEEKKYFVPIGEVTRKRTNRRALMVLLLVIVLAVAAADLLIDAGIIKVNGLPSTHIFKQTR